MRALILFLFLQSLFLLPRTRCTTRSLLSSHQEKGMLMEDKTRLGSTPPNCHNRCSSCNPCFPVQVPAIAVQAKQRGVKFDGNAFGFLENSNYKPLGWKCQCQDQLYNP